MLVPGVSGGSMAMILGIYDKLIESVSSFFENIKTNLCFLLIFVISAGSGMFLLARPILSLLETYPKPMQCFFIGAVAGGIPAIWKQAQIKKISIKHIVYIVTGFLLVTGISLFPSEVFVNSSQAESFSTVFLIVSGIIAAAALVLPGISVSYFLLVLGLYHELMRAISELDMHFLIPMGVGILVGIVLITKCLEYVMKSYPQITYLIIMGFIIGSVIEIMPEFPQGIEWILCIVAITAGYFFIGTLSYVETKNT